MDKHNQQRIVMMICQKKEFGRLSKRLKNAYDRGRDGMRAAWSEDQLEFTAWKAGRLEFEHMAAIRSRVPAQEKRT